MTNIASFTKVRLIGAVLLLAGGLGQPLSADETVAVEAGNRAFAPPDGPLLVTRTLVRALVDGKQIITRRTYRVTFHRDGPGFIVQGQQTASEIEAPAELAAIAAIERARPDISSFPLQLDQAGFIVSPAVLAPDAQRDAGIAVAQGIVAGAALDNATRTAADRFLAEAAAKGQIVPWPRNLFHPTAADHDVAQAVALPGGENGRVLITHRISARLPGGAPARFLRTVTTEMAGVRRESREEWNIATAPT